MASGIPRFELSPHNCFACGTLNEHGLQLALHVGPGRSWTDLVLDRRFEGWDGIAHGGILATILDEVMAWALVGEDNWGVTARLAIDFRRPADVGLPLHAEGWITSSRRRLVETAGHIVDATSGAEIATASAVYLAADERRRQELRERYGFRLVPAENDPDHDRNEPATDTPGMADRARDMSRSRSDSRSRPDRIGASRSRDRAHL